MILQRYLIKEILVPLAVWVGFLFLLLIVMQFLRGTDVLLGSGIRGSDLALLMAYMTPHFLVMALPVALLLAILLGLGRLSEDRELTALQASGVGPMQILSVPLGLGVVLCAVMMALTWSLEPWGLGALQGVVNDVIKRNVMGDVKPGVFHEGLSRLTLYAERVDTKSHVWQNVLVHDEQNAATPMLVLARRGHINSQASREELKLVLERAEAHRSSRASTDYHVVDFDRGEIAVWLGDTLWRGNHFSSQMEAMTPADLKRELAAAQSRGEDTAPYSITLNSRLGRAFTPLAFAFIAAPLALMGGRGRRARGFTLTLFAYIGYYVIVRAFEAWGAQGRMSHALAAQLPNVLFIALGLVGLVWVARKGEQR